MHVTVKEFRDAAPNVLRWLVSRTAVGEATRQSWLRRVVEPSPKAFESGNLEEDTDNS